jgi:hypothetical protein
VVATVRALYDVVGIITVAQAHRADTILRRRADLPWREPTAITDTAITDTAESTEHAETVAG